MEQEEIFLFFPRKRMKLRSYGRRGMRLNKLTILIVSMVVCLILFIYYLNERLMPTYLQYAEVQTTKIASYVVSKAINSRTSNVLDVNDIIEDIPPGTSEMMTTKFNTEIINRVRAETLELVKMYLEQAEQGELSHLPELDNVEYDINRIQDGDGIVFLYRLVKQPIFPCLEIWGQRSQFASM